MERKIIIKDINGKEVEKTFKVRDISHLISCVKYKSTTTKNKKRYTRKEKYKKDYSEN